MSALSSGHLVTDLAQGSLPAFLPFLVDEFGLSYTMAAALVLAGTFASSIIQPLFGLWSDARGALWLLPAGVAIAGVGMGAAALAPSYPLVVLAVVVSGLGVAAYHPEGSKFASYVSGGRRASGMAFFSVGGNVGFALGPLVASFVIITLGFGLEGGALVAIPGLIVAVVLLGVRDYLASFTPEGAVGADRRREPSQRRGMAVLLSVVGLRWSRTWGSSPSCRSTRFRAATARRTASGCSPSSCSPARSGRSSVGRSPTGSGAGPSCGSASRSRRR